MTSAKVDVIPPTLIAKPSDFEEVVYKF